MTWGVLHAVNGLQFLCRSHVLVLDGARPRLKGLATVVASNMAPFNVLPKDVYPLVAATAVGVTFMVASGYHALFNSPEVHLTKRTRSDEMLEEPDIAPKGAAVRSRSPFAWLGRSGQ